MAFGAWPTVTFFGSKREFLFNGEAVQILRDEGFDARRGGSCTFCQYKRVCPGWEQGEQVTP